MAGNASGTFNWQHGTQRNEIALQPFSDMTLGSTDFCSQYRLADRKFDCKFKWGRHA
jgi:hypothetical protein